MSTSDPPKLNLPAEGPGAGEIGKDSRGLVSGMPDVAVIARLANEFFSTLPGGLPKLEGEADPATSFSQPLDSQTNASFGAQDLKAPNSFAPVGPAIGSRPQDSADSIPELNSLREADSIWPLAATPSLLSFDEAFQFPQVPGDRTHSALPALPSSRHAAPLRDANAHDLAMPFGNDAALPFLSRETATVSSVPRNEEGVSPFSVAPSFPSVTDLAFFPGVPGAQSAPNVPVLSSSPSENAAVVSELPSSAAPPGVSPAVQIDKTSSGKEVTPPVGAFDFRPDLVPNLGLSPRPYDPHLIRRDFPILQERIHGRPLVWLDNAATTQKPNAVIDRISAFYRHENSNIHRAAHTLAARATDAYESAREKARRFLNAPSTREIIFVRGATEGINLVAQSWGRRNVQKDDEIVITWLEHHANIVPWQQLAADKGARLRVAPVDDRGDVVLEEYEKLLGPRTRIVSFSQVSNALGTLTPAGEMIAMAHRHGARVLLDAAQSVAHMATDVQMLDCDFLVFSGHKIFAPTGIGVVYGRADILDTTPPWQGGGNMIQDVTFEKTVYNVAPARFEAGTGNIADAVGLGAALDYIDEIGLDGIQRYEHELIEYMVDKLVHVRGLRLIGTPRERAGVVSFVLEGMPTEEVGKALNQEGIAVRAGHHCAQPILRRMGVEASVRPSLALYNTHEDVDALAAALHRIQAGRV